MAWNGEHGVSLSTSNIQLKRKRPFKKAPKLDDRHFDTLFWLIIIPESRHKDVGLEIVLLPISLMWQAAAHSNRLKV